MKTFNESDLSLAWLPGKLQSPAHSLTLVVKGCFDLKPDSKAMLSEDPDASAILGDVFWGDDTNASLKQANELVIFKPKADLTLSGVAYPQPGEAGCRVTFAVGNWQKSLAIFNDRYWRWGKATAPEPFGAEVNEVPLTYENAFGGEHYKDNPVGKGLDAVDTVNGERLQPLPNIEHPQQFVSSPSQKTMPAGFGPLRDNWADKTELKGTYSDAWLKTHYPYFPEDFDWGYFNVAPKDQQVPYLQGDEALYFENLRPELPQMRSQLPAIRPRLFLNGEVDDKAFFQEVTLRLDTLHIDMEAQQVSLIWRGVVGVQSDEYEEISDACLFIESMEEQAQSQDLYYQQFLAQQHAGDPEEEIEEFEDGNGKDLDIPEQLTEAKEVVEKTKANVPDPTDLAFEENMEKLRDLMRKQGLPDELVSEFGLKMDPQGFLNKVMKTFNLDPATGQQLIVQGQESLKAMFEAQGLDTAELDAAAFDVSRLKVEPTDETQANADPDGDVPGTEPIKPGTSEEDESLTGQDLSNQDLSNRDFRESDLSGVIFNGADISGSDFSGADLSNAKFDDVIAVKAVFDDAILTGASGSGANFSESSMKEAVLQQVRLIKPDFTKADVSSADFTDAVLPGALFENSVMSEALFERTDLSHCQLTEVIAKGTLFTQSNLRECFCFKSDLTEAVFTGSRLTLAQFDNSNLNDAILESVAGQSTRFINCMMNKMRAGESSDLSGAEFIGGEGDGIMFDGTNLANAKFSEIPLSRADFTQAELQFTHFSHCDMKQADFSKANLTEAGLSGINLFEASFGKATLVRTDLSSSNLYGAEFYQAQIQDSKLQGANIKQTKLELGLVK